MAVLDPLPYWFVIDGQAVRCSIPYRPSRDVDLGVPTPADLDDLLAHLIAAGRTEVDERSADTAHLRWDGIHVPVFVLPFLLPFVADKCLTTTGILATKLHGILDRGTRRDFFDLYVTLQHHRLGLIECLGAIRRVYRQDVDEGLLLRALTYFDDAEREAPLPAEGPNDWRTVKDYFRNAVGALIVPPGRPLEIQGRCVDLA
jgi:hypothetical protein